MRKTKLMALSALALFTTVACGDGSDSQPCAEYGEGACICRDEPREDDVAFEGNCTSTDFDGRAICCQGTDYCVCMPVRCGISAFDGDCVCGVGVFLDSLVASCTGTASTCCTQGTGYCYCEDGCVNRFGNTEVAGCDTTTSAATCAEDEVKVSSCE